VLVRRAVTRPPAGGGSRRLHGWGMLRRGPGCAGAAASSAGPCARQCRCGPAPCGGAPRGPRPRSGPAPGPSHPTPGTAPRPPIHPL
jgi:hypothetical protein